jgi:hypothetical protein
MRSPLGHFFENRIDFLSVERLHSFSTVPRKSAGNPTDFNANHQVAIQKSYALQPIKQLYFKLQQINFKGLPQPTT